MEKKISGKGFSFLDKWIWIACMNLSQLTSECFSSPVMMLPKDPKTLDITNRDFFQLKFFHNDQET